MELDKYVNGTAAYNYGSAAPYTDIPATKPRLVEVPKTNKATVSDARKIAKVMCACLLVIAVLMAVTVHTQVLLMQAKSTVENMEEELAELTETNNNKKIQLEKSVDLKKVEEIAISQYGMQRPDKNQIVYVRVVQNDYGEVINSAMN